jgi:hypothetical protein
LKTEIENGIPPDAYEAALKAIDAVAVKHSSVRTAITDRKAVTRSLPRIMQTGNRAPVKLDNLISVFEAEHPEIVSGYKTARTIIHTGIRHKDDETPDVAEAS